MAEETRRPDPSTDDERALEELGHPRGTLAIVIAYAVLFAVGWLALYVFRFLGGGAPHAGH